MSKSHGLNKPIEEISQQKCVIQTINLDTYPTHHRYVHNPSEMATSFPKNYSTKNAISIKEEKRKIEVAHLSHIHRTSLPLEWRRRKTATRENASLWYWICLISSVTPKKVIVISVTKSTWFATYRPNIHFLLTKHYQFSINRNNVR